MKTTINLFLVISSIFLLTACTPKLTIQALQASKVEGIKVNIKHKLLQMKFQTIL